MAYILTSIFFWVVAGLLIPFKQWRSYYPVIIFSGLLAMVSDLCGVVFMQWFYIGPKVGGLSIWSDLAIATGEGLLFIRLFPRNPNILVRVVYLVTWSFLNAFFEWYFVKVGWIGYHQWNPVRAFLFYLLYFGLIWLQEFWYNGTGKLRG